MAQLVGGPGMSTDAYTSGVKAGTDARVADYQTQKLSAETRKILDELNAAREARQITGVALANAIGVPRETAEVISAGKTTMPSYVMRSGAREEPIAQNLIDKTQRANAALLLYKLTGQKDLAGQMEKLQSQSIMDKLLSGQRKPGEILPMVAASKGKYAPAGSSATKTSQIKNFRFLKGQGFDDERAMMLSFSNLTPDEAYNSVYKAVLAQTVGSHDRAKEVADQYMSDRYGHGSAGWFNPKADTASKPPAPPANVIGSYDENGNFIPAGQ